MTRTPGQKQGLKPNRRRDPTTDETKELVGTVRSGIARLTPKELKRIKHLTKKVIALNVRRHPKNRRLKDSNRVIIDSGATITLLKKHRWLRQLATRLTAM